MIEASFQRYIQDQLSSLLGSSVELQSIQMASGGSINQAYNLRTNQGLYFLKYNERQRFPKMFELEAKGLELLSAHSSFEIPKVIASGHFEEKSYLLLEGIQASTRAMNYWEEFGRNLAQLHKYAADKFGLDQDNYIGSLPQPNHWTESWSEFFVQHRLEYQHQMARDAGLVDATISQLFNKFYPQLENLFPEAQAALLHGDLWSGNFMTNQKGQATIFDPAVYFGHREMDIAMSHLFGGFQKPFYAAYHEAFPLDQGWEERIEICNLYPLMVHVNLFGTSYANRVKAILKRYS